MLSVFDINNDADCMLLAYIYMKRGDNIKAYTYYYKVYQKEAANIKALKGAALTAFRSENYVSAAKLYDALINTHGEKAMKHHVHWLYVWFFRVRPTKLFLIMLLYKLWEQIII